MLHSPHGWHAKRKQQPNKPLICSHRSSRALKQFNPPPFNPINDSPPPPDANLSNGKPYFVFAVCQLVEWTLFSSIAPWKRGAVAVGSVAQLIDNYTFPWIRIGNSQRPVLLFDLLIQFQYSYFSRDIDTTWTQMVSGVVVDLSSHDDFVSNR